MDFENPDVLNPSTGKYVYVDTGLKFERGTNKSRSSLEDKLEELTNDIGLKDERMSIKVLNDGRIQYYLDSPRSKSYEDKLVQATKKLLKLPINESVPLARQVLNKINEAFIPPPAPYGSNNGKPYAGYKGAVEVDLQGTPVYGERGNDTYQTLFKLLSPIDSKIAINTSTGYKSIIVLSRTISSDKLKDAVGKALAKDWGASPSIQVINEATPNAKYNKELDKINESKAIEIEFTGGSARPPVVGQLTFKDGRKELVKVDYSSSLDGRSNVPVFRQVYNGEIKWKLKEGDTFTSSSLADNNNWVLSADVAAYKEKYSKSASAVEALGVGVK